MEKYKPRSRIAHLINNCKECIFFSMDNTDYTAARITDNRFRFYCTLRKDLICYTPTSLTKCHLFLTNEKESP